MSWPEVDWSQAPEGTVAWSYVSKGIGRWHSFVWVDPNNAGPGLIRQEHGYPDNTQ